MSAPTSPGPPAPSSSNPQIATGPVPVAAGPAPAPAALTTQDPPRLLDFLAGLPALIAAFGTMAILAASVATPPRAADYEIEYESRLARGDIPGAMVCLRRAVALNPTDENRWKMVLLCARTGDIAKADTIARSLVPPDDASNKDGYPAAHLYIAKRLMGDPASFSQNAALALRKILSNLQKYIALSQKAYHTQDVKEGKGLLGEFYARTGQLKEARPLLEETAGEDPKRLFLLGAICDEPSINDPNKAVTHYDAAIKAAIAKVKFQPNDLSARYYWAMSLRNLKKFEESLQVLAQGLEVHKDERVQQDLHRLMAETCLLWVITVPSLPDKASSDKMFISRIKLVERLLNDDPKSRDFLGILARLMEGTGKEADEAKKILNRMVATAQSPGMAHFFLGNDAWRRNEFEVARTHWEEAFKLEPKMAIIANNLAFILANRDPTDPKRALGIVDQAMSVPMTNLDLKAQLVGTRGQVLTKLERWKEALTDLESALRAGQNTPGIHSALAETYKHLEMPDLAAEHKKISDDLKKPKPAAK